MDEYAATLDIDGSGNVYITGGTWKFMQGIPSDILTIKYRANGDTAWTRRYNGAADDDDEPEEIAYDGRGNIYITGDSWGGSGTRTDYCTLKYDTLGDLKWTRRYDAPAHQNEHVRAIAVDVNSSVYVTGESMGSVDNDYASVVYDSLGDQITAQRYDGPGTWADAAQAIAADGIGNFYVTGFSGGDGSTYDFCTIKYSDITGIESEFPARTTRTWELPTIFNGDLLLPAPSNCRIFDITGRQVDARNISTGVFFVEIDAGKKGRVIQKIVKIK
jgi:hypothetical protein